jgi:hypothetical protein
MQKQKECFSEFVENKYRNELIYQSNFLFNYASMIIWLIINI